MVVTPHFNSTQLIAPSPGTGPGIGGSVMYAPLGTALPTTTGATLNSAFTDLGYVDDKGIRDKEERRTTDTFAWGGGLVGTIQDSYTRTMTVTFLQFLDPSVLEVTYGANNVVVTPNTGSTGTEVAVACNDLLLDTLSWVFQGFYGNSLVAKVIPIARIVTVGEVNFTHKAFTTVEVTIKAFPDKLNNHAYLYTDDGVTTTDGS
jgi:hypothetical protein